MRKSTLSMVLLLAVIISSCSGDKDKPSSDSPFVGGDRGLVMSFVDGAPPPEIYDANQFLFDIAVKLSNEGETDVRPEDGYIQIIGINPADFGTTQENLKKPIPALLKRARKNFEGTVLLGDIAIAEFSQLKYIPDVVGNFNGPIIRANACYNYATRASSKVCVKPDLLSNIDNQEIWALSGNKVVSNSGGPLHITSVTQQPLGGSKIQVQFVIEHTGGANERFFKPNTDCLDRPTNPDRDVVFVEILSDVAGVIAQCSGFNSATGTGTGGGNPSPNAGFVKLFDGAPRTILCSFDIANVQSEFEELLEIGLRYRYYQYIETPILVRDVTTSD